MSTSAFVLLFLGALAGGFVSGLAGFGTALMALGIWLYVLPPSIAVPLVLICSIVAQTSTLPSGGRRGNRICRRNPWRARRPVRPDSDLVGERAGLGQG
jgi:uncharacterized membrane protein YfcA